METLRSCHNCSKDINEEDNFAAYTPEGSKDALPFCLLCFDEIRFSHAYCCNKEKKISPQKKPKHPKNTHKNMRQAGQFRFWS